MDHNDASGKVIDTSTLKTTTARTRRPADPERVWTGKDHWIPVLHVSRQSQEMARHE